MPIEWSASGSKSLGRFDQPRTERRKEARHVRRGEGEDWKSCQETMGEIPGTSEESNRVGSGLALAI
jgi:hypothetical protein